MSDHASEANVPSATVPSSPTLAKSDQTASSTALGKRKAAAKAQENATSSAKLSERDIYDVEDDEAPAPKRTKTKGEVSLQADTTPKASSTTIKAPSRTIGNAKFVGYHKMDNQNRLKVFAVYYPGGQLNFRVMKEECSAETKEVFKEFFKTKAQATVSFIRFDPTIFPSISDETFDEKDIKKIEVRKAAVRTYLASLGIHKDINSKIKIEDSEEVSSQPPAASSTFSSFGRRINPTERRTRGTSKTAAPRATIAPVSAPTISRNVVAASSKTTIPAKKALVPALAPVPEAQGPNVVSTPKAKARKPARTARVSPVKKVKIAKNTKKKPASKVLTPEEKAREAIGEAELTTLGATPSEIPSDQEAPDANDYTKDLLVGAWEVNPDVKLYAYLVQVERHVEIRIRRHPHDPLPDMWMERQIEREEVSAFPEDNYFPFRHIYPIDEYDFGREDTFLTWVHTNLRCKFKEFPLHIPYVLPAHLRPNCNVDAGVAATLPQVINVETKSVPAENGPRERTAKELSERGSFGVLGEVPENIMVTGDVDQDSLDNEAGPSDKVTDMEVAPAPLSQEEQIQALQRQLQHRDTIIAKREATIEQQKAQLTEAKKNFREISTQKALKDARTPAATSGRITIEEKIYDVIITGPNAGKFISHRWEKVVDNGKTYKQFTILLPITLSMGNEEPIIHQKHRPAPVVPAAEPTFTKIPDGTHAGMLITTKSLVDLPAGSFIKWLLRDEIALPDDI